jgi:hypothetical protein
MSGRTALVLVRLLKGGRLWICVTARCGGTESGGLFKEWIRSVYERGVDRKAQQHGTPWPAASDIMLSTRRRVGRREAEGTQTGSART